MELVKTLSTLNNEKLCEHTHFRSIAIASKYAFSNYRKNQLERQSIIFGSSRQENVFRQLQIENSRTSFTT